MNPFRRRTNPFYVQDLWWYAVLRRFASESPAFARYGAAGANSRESKRRLLSKRF